MVNDNLVGGFNPSEKYSSMGKILPYIMENQKCVKPPPEYESQLGWLLFRIWIWWHSQLNGIH